MKCDRSLRVGMVSSLGEGESNGIVVVLLKVDKGSG
jgi:hypothetical protein